jgi:hypothetical protein
MLYYIMLAYRVLTSAGRGARSSAARCSGAPKRGCAGGGMRAPRLAACGLRGWKAATHVCCVYTRLVALKRGWRHAGSAAREHAPYSGFH